MASFTSRSTSAISSLVILRPKEKSKRRRSAVMLEPFWATFVAQHLAQGGVQQVRGGMQTGALLAVIRQTALKALLRARLAGGLMLLEALA